ncbi:MAG: globin domain-containing protein [Planctomycetaceae bacterium]
MDDDILQEFIAKSWENLARLESEIVTLETDPSNPTLLTSIFRTIHTIQGACGFIGLTQLGYIVHAVENALGQMRDQAIAVSPMSISLVREAIDEIKSLLLTLEATGEEPPHYDHSPLIRRLNELAQIPTRQAVSVSPDVTVSSPPSLNAGLLQQSFKVLAPKSDRLARDFFATRFAMNPHYRPLFTNADFADIRQKLIQVLVLVVKSADNPVPITKILRELGQRHAEYGITSDDYAPFGESLLAALAETTGGRWTSAMNAAWKDAIAFVAEQMIAGANELPARFHTTIESAEPVFGINHRELNRAIKT